MINVHNLSVSFNGDYLLENVSFRLNVGDKVGLVGKNGAGKSTMLKILSKEQPAEAGTIATDKEVKIGFLKQDIDFEKGRTVLEEAYQAFSEVLSIQGEINNINKELSNRTDYESESYHKLIEKLSEHTERFELLGGYQFVGDTERVLLGLGFKREEFYKPTDTFSGGWRMRIELAKLLLQNNDLLLLDEPTNHLDIESIIWFEEFLKTFSGAVILVSHDKMFLDNVTNRTIEISNRKIYDFNKSYSKYLIEREEQLKIQLAAQKNQAKKIEETEKLIEKFRYKATKASMAQSLIKKLDKIDRIEIEDSQQPIMNISFPMSITPGKIVLEIEKVTKTFDGKNVFQNIDLQIERGEKIAFVGQNGQGKSTLIKAIMNEFDYQGNIKIGHNVELGYFAQNQSDYLNKEKTLLDVMLDNATDTNRSKVRDMLGAFLFRDDAVDKKIKVLSGGERNRFALCVMLLKPFNVLLMDEPTNHLDIQSKEVLKEALKKYEGTLIVVSHDRDFLQDLCEKTIEFKDGKIKEYLGDINYFLEQKKVSDIRTLEETYTPTEKKSAVDKIEKTLSYEEQKRLKSLQNKLAKTEKEIAELEKKISEADLQLADNYEEMITDNNWFVTYENLKKQLESAMLLWEEIAIELEK